MIYLVFGEQELMINKLVDKLAKETLEEIDDFNLVTFDAHKYPMYEIVNDASTLPFMTDKKVVVIKNAYFLTTENPKLEFEQSFEELEEYLNNENEGVSLIFSVVSAKLDERKSLVKLARKKFIIRKIEETSKNDWPILIKKVLVNHKVDITKDATEYLIANSNNDLNKVSNEIAKFELYGEKITLEVAKALVSQPLEDNAFGMADAILSHDIARALEIYQDLRIQNEEPIRLISTIANQIRFIYQVNIYYRKGLVSEDSIARELQASPYRVKLALRKMKIATPDRLLNILHELSVLDVNIKSGTVDRFQGFELFLLKDL